MTNHTLSDKISLGGRWTKKGEINQRGVLNIQRAIVTIYIVIHLFTLYFGQVGVMSKTLTMGQITEESSIIGDKEQSQCKMNIGSALSREYCVESGVLNLHNKSLKQNRNVFNLLLNNIYISINKDICYTPISDQICL